MQYIIRLAETNDISQIETIANTAYSIYLHRMNKKPFPMLDDYHKHVAEKNVYVICDAKRIFGYVVCMQKSSNTLLLDNIAILPELQNKGYGRKLIQYVENFAKEQKYQYIILYTNEVMQENILFYTSLGYKITDTKIEIGYKRIYFMKQLRN